MDDLWEDFNAAEAAEAERHATEQAEDLAAEALMEMVGDVFGIDPETAALALLAASTVENA